MKSNYKYDSTEVKWEYIVDFYNKDKTMAPKWKDKHIILPSFSAMRVNLAAQTLCKTLRQFSVPHLVVLCTKVNYSRPFTK